MQEIEKMDDIVETKPEMVPLGPVELMTEKGPAIYFDSILCANGQVTLPDGSRKVTIMMLVDEPATAEGEHRLGAVAQFTPDGARTFAATLCQVADKIDGGIKN